MQLDLKITGGHILDGTGAPAFRADIGVAGGRIVAIGHIDMPAGRVIDAEGAIVTPGFVDLHSHYDGQATWDADLLPSSAHGVTTVLLGNCGVGFAPVRPSDRDRLIRLFEGVEDIPGTALAEGIRWRWEDFPSYLDALEAMPHTLDVAAQVPHDALRVFVMGERALAGELARPEDALAMQKLLREALQAGAAGFSTGRTDNHRAVDGSATPASEANAAELGALAGAFHGLDHGVLQAVSDFDLEQSAERFDAEFDVLEGWARAAGGHKVSLSLLQRDLAPNQWRRILTRAEKLHADGIDFRVQTASRAIGVLLGLEATFHTLLPFPTYQALAHLPLAERVLELRRPDIRARILAEKPVKIAGDGSPIPPLADRLLAHLEHIAGRIFRLGDPPDYEPPPSASLLAEARVRGVPVQEVLYDALLEDDGHQLLYFPIYNYMGGNLDAVGEMLHHPLAFPGLGDGGAHVGTICDASMSTFLLTHWTRDRASGRMPLAHAVHLLTARPAEFIGMRDRGLIQVGLRADLNVIDMAKLRLRRPKLVCDLPAGGKRLLQEAEGYRATVVAGDIIAVDGVLTGALPGRLKRMGR